MREQVYGIEIFEYKRNEYLIKNNKYGRVYKLRRIHKI